MVVSSTLLGGMATTATQEAAEATPDAPYFSDTRGLATWGNLLRDAQAHMQTLPIFAIAPGMMFFLTVISINFVGDGLRDALDPHGRR